MGLFGGIASGKSRVAAHLHDRGATVLDADRLAHEELARPEARAALLEALGPAALGPDGAADRKSIADIVFRDPERLRRLEAILHPRVLARMAEEVARRATPAGARREVVVLDAPLLAEAGGLGMCEEVLFVDAPLAARLERAKGRGWSEEELRRREARQMPLEEKRRAASFVARNDGDLAALEAEVDRFWRARIAPRIEAEAPAKSAAPA